MPLRPVALVVALAVLGMPGAGGAAAPALSLGKSTIQRTVDPASSKTLREVMKRLQTLERVHGNNDGSLAPRVLARADPLVRAVMHAVYGKDPPHELALGEIETRLRTKLPDLAIRGRSDPALRPVHDQLIGEVAEQLADDYARDVRRDQSANAHQFQRTRGISLAAWKQLQRWAPGKFMLGEARARPGELADDELAALASKWDREVVRGDKRPQTFYLETGVSEKRMTRLRRVDPRFRDPARRPTNGSANDDAALALIAERVHALYEKDVLINREGIAAAINGDAALVARVGPVSPSRLNRLFAADRAAFPDLTDVGAKLRTLAEELRPLVAQGLSDSGLVAVMKRRHPGFTLSRLEQVREQHEGLAATKAVKESRAPSAASLRYPKPERKIPLKDKTIRPLGRDSLAITRLVEVAVEVAPPGATYDDVHRAVAQLLVARGISPFEHEGSIQNVIERALGGRTLGDINAAKAAEVIGEYARLAGAGTSHEDILAAVRERYPLLTPQLLGKLTKKWLAEPRAFPALAPFLRGGRLVLVGKQERITQPRYQKGWDIERALLSADGDRQEALIRLSAAARVSTRMALLDEIIADLDGGQPLQQTNVVWVTHVLGTTVPLGIALKAAGASTEQTFVVSSPYGVNEQAREALEHEGFRVRTPRLDTADYRRQVQRALDQAVAKHRLNGQPIVVLDDGGLVAEILHADPKYADVRSAVKIVEQTTRGLTAAEQLKLEVPIIAAAAAASKIHEGTFIGRAVAAKVLQSLRRVNESQSLKGKTVVVFGYGTIGAPLAEQLKAAGAKVLVVEPGEQNAAAAREAGFQVLSKRAALRRAEMVVGATGERSLEVEDLALLRNGAIVASASSKQVEFDMQGLRARASKRTLLRSTSPLATLPSAIYRLGGRSITMLGDGWPVNFDGDVESVPADEIQLTRAVMLLGAIQARSTRSQPKNHRIIPFGERPDDGLGAKVRDADRQLLARYRALRKGQPESPVSDPDRWQGIFHEVAAAFTIR